MAANELTELTENIYGAGQKGGSVDACIRMLKDYVRKRELEALKERLESINERMNNAMPEGIDYDPGEKLNEMKLIAVNALTEVRIKLNQLT